MFLNLRPFAPLLGAAMLVLAGCQAVPQNPDTSSSEPAEQAQEQSAPPAESSHPASPAAPALTPATNSHASFFIGETHSAPDLTAVKMVDGTRLYLQREPVLKGEDITQAHDLVDKQGRHFIGVRFTKAGASKLADVSAKSKGKRLVLILNGRAEAAPVIGEPLDHGVLAFSVPSALAAANLAARIRGEQPPELKFTPAAKAAEQEKTESKAEPDAEAGQKSKASSKPTTESEHEVESKPKAEPRHKVESKPKTEPRHKVEPKHKVEHKAEAKHKSEPAHKADTAHKTEPKTKSQPESSSKTPAQAPSDKPKSETLPKTEQPAGSAGKTDQ